MREHMTIPGKLTIAEVQFIADQLNNITLPDGRKPFVVAEIRKWANHEIYLKNECCTAVLLFRMAPEEQEEE